MSKELDDNSGGNSNLQISRLLPTSSPSARSAPLPGLLWCHRTLFPLTCVFSGMGNERTGDGKGFSTAVTHVGLLPCVATHVVGERAGLSKSLAAAIAHIWLLATVLPANERRRTSVILGRKEATAVTNSLSSISTLPQNSVNYKKVQALHTWHAPRELGMFCVIVYWKIKWWFLTRKCNSCSCQKCKKPHEDSTELQELFCSASHQGTFLSGAISSLKQTHITAIRMLVHRMSDS